MVHDMPIRSGVQSVKVKYKCSQGQMLSTQVTSTEPVDQVVNNFPIKTS